LNVLRVSSFLYKAIVDKNIEAKKMKSKYKGILPKNLKTKSIN